MKLSYFVIPAIIALSAFTGSLITNSNMDWYKTINLPWWTPPGFLIAMIWTTIFIFTSISAILFWNKAEKDRIFWKIAVLFLINILLNVFWSYLFFDKHLIATSIVEMVFLEITVILLMIFLNKAYKPSALLLLPYALWVAFATYVAFSVLMLN